MSLISIGLSGLNASQTALSVTSNNISNAATTGYSRQSAVQAASMVQSMGVGYLGTGTTVSDIRRIYNGYMDSQLQTSTALQADASTYSTQVGATDKLLSDSGTGINSALTSFFTAMQSASSSPNDTSARQMLMTQAKGLSDRFNSISDQLNQQNQNINTQLTTLATQVNKLTSSIASLNQQIGAATGNGAPNSLLDARNESVRQLNELVGVTVQQRDGNYDVYLGTGQALVTGVSSNTLTAAPSAADKSQYGLSVNYQNQSTDVTSVVAGGEIGGLLRYRSDVLNPALNELGRVAMVAADAVNAQLSQGLDANGEFGSSLFASLNNDIAITQRSAASSNNSKGSGNLDVSINEASKLTAYDYTVKFSSKDEYSVMRSDGTAMGSFSLEAKPAPVIDGFTLALNGNELANGDTFKVSPTRTGASNIRTTLTDPSKLAFAGPLVGTLGSGNVGTGVIIQPSLTDSVNLASDAAASELKTAIANSTPVKLVMGGASNGSQTYTVYNAKGDNIGTGSIVPGQDNKQTIAVPMVDASGAAITTADGAQKTFKFDMTISGSPVSGDSFSVAFNADGKTDNRNATALLGLQTKATVGVANGNTGASLTNAYASLVSSVGAKASQAVVDTSATEAILSQAKTNRDSVSGVSLDEEAANLIKFQQYYTASSQIIKSAQEMFNTLLSVL